MLTNELKLFAGDNTDFYDAAMSYFCDGKKTAENKALMNPAFLAEVERKAGVSRAGNEMGAWMANPNVKWSAFSIIDAVINAIMPITILPQFNMFADFRTQGFGDVTKFTIRPNSLYTISKGSHGERVVARQRHFSKDLLVTPVEHTVSIYENMYSVLAGRTDIADFLGWVLLSIQTEMYKDALSAFTTGINAQSSPWKYTGAFSLSELVKLCETVQAKNGGIKPVICGSASALLNVLPDASAGFRMNIDGSDAQIELVKTALGFPVIKLENAIDANNQLLLATDELYIICPNADKLVKGVMVTSLSNGNDGFMNADLTKDYTTRKEWEFVYSSSVKGGVYKIQ